MVLRRAGIAARPRGAFLCLLAALFLSLAHAGPAAAHAVLLETSPPAGAALDRPPEGIELRFSEPVTPVVIRIFDGVGQELGQDMRVEAAGDRVILRPGHIDEPARLLISWRVTSLDSHPVAGSFSFTVGPVAADGAGSVVNDGIDWRWPALLTRTLHIGTTLFAAGLALAFLLLHPPAPLTAAMRRAGAWLAISGVLAVALRGAVAGADLAGLAPEALLGPEPWSVLANVTLGRALLASALGQLLLLAGFATRAGRLRVGLLSGGCALTLLSFAAAGHVATAHPAWLILPTILLHVGCAAFWIGSLWPLARALHLPAGQGAAITRRFSELALLSTNLLLIAGFVLAWTQVQSPAHLLDTAYGQKLLVKLALVGGMLALAGINLLAVVPNLAAGRPGLRRALRAGLALDGLLAAGVVVMTASLQLDPPPRLLPAPAAAMDKGGDAAGKEGWAVHLADGNYAVILWVGPARVGTNRLELNLTDRQGAPVLAQEVKVRFSLPAAGIEGQTVRAQPEGHGNFTVTSRDFVRAGAWRLRVDALIDDFTQASFATEVPMAAPEP